MTQSIKPGIAGFALLRWKLCCPSALIGISRAGNLFLANPPDTGHVLTWNFQFGGEKLVLGVVLGGCVCVSTLLQARRSRGALWLSLSTSVADWWHSEHAQLHNSRLKPLQNPALLRVEFPSWLMQPYFCPIAQTKHLKVVFPHTFQCLFFFLTPSSPSRPEEFPARGAGCSLSSCRPCSTSLWVPRGFQSHPHLTEHQAPSQMASWAFPRVRSELVSHFLRCGGFSSCVTTCPKAAAAGGSLLGRFHGHLPTISPRISCHPISGSFLSRCAPASFLLGSG